MVTTAEWQRLTAPDLKAFEAMAEAGFASLPESFRVLCGAIEIRVADFADEDALAAVGLESEFDLMGLFEGVGLAHGEAVAHTGRMPNRIWLYRRAILDYWAENEETLGDIVTHVLVHEIGHHFGLSDEDIDAIEAEAD